MRVCVCLCICGHVSVFMVLCVLFIDEAQSLSRGGIEDSVESLSSHKYFAISVGLLLL